MTQSESCAPPLPSVCVSLTAPDKPDMRTEFESKLNRPEDIPDEVNSPSSQASLHVVSEDVLNQLSRQLEYYFSAANLSRDTYLRTLRELNDGYVPAAILANFAKVQRICPHDSYNAVLLAATDYSEFLEVVNVDKETSQKVSKEEGKQTLLAIGPRDLKPIELPSTAVAPSTLALRNSTTAVQVNIDGVSDPSVSIATSQTAAATASPVNSVQNTIILREVPDRVTENDIRELFDMNMCPPIEHIVEDIPGFWFVTLNTTSRDDVVGVMLALKSKTFNGEPVKARLKSAAITSPISSFSGISSNCNLLQLQTQIYGGDRNLAYDPYYYIHNNQTKGETGSDSKKKLGNTQLHQVTTTTTSLRDGRKSNRRSNRKSRKDMPPINNANHQIHNQDSHVSPPSLPPPPLFVESHFPSLEPVSRALDPVAVTASMKTSTIKNKEEDDEEKPMSASDGASTATTSSSSSVAGDGPKPRVTGGYAAALLKPAATPPSSQSPTNDHFGKHLQVTNGSKGSKNSINGQKDCGVPKEVKTEEENHSVVDSVVAMSWGGGRSFADVLKKQEKVNSKPLLT